MKTKQLIPLFLLVLALFSCKSLQKKNSTVGAVKVSDAVKEIYYEAEAEYIANRMNEAKVLFEKFVKQSPLPAPGYYRLACIEKRAGNIDASGSWIYKAQQADTSNYHYNLFEASLHQGRRDFLKAGIIYYERAILPIGPFLQMGQEFLPMPEVMNCWFPIVTIGKRHLA